jgi:hypothetical protein
MHISFKTIKYFISLYAARHASDTIVSIIRSFLLLHMQSLVTYQITDIVFVYVKFVNAKQAGEIYEYKNIKRKLQNKQILCL